MTVASPPPPLPKASPRKAWGSPARLLDVLTGTAMAALCTLVGWACRPWADLSFLIMLFLMGAVLTALWRGRLASMVASILGMLAFDYFFEYPTFSFGIAHWPSFLVFTGFLVISQLVGNLVFRLRAQARQALLRERETAALYALAGVLSAESSPEPLKRAAERHLSGLWGVRVRIPGPEAPEPATGITIPLKGATHTLGVIHLEGDPAPQVSWTFKEACARQVTLALERALLSEEAERAQTKAELEHTRSTLLSAVSHDFRTPLSTIFAAAATLVQEPEIQAAPDLRDLAELIAGESSRLNHLVGNLLDMMRFEAGALRPNLELQPLEEVVGTVLDRLEPRLGPISAELPDDLPSLAMDSVLVEQLLTNLLENAFRHGRGRGVRLRAAAAGGAIRVEVADQGPGVSSDRRESIFEKFYRPREATWDGGFGLGLAICQAIVHLHGGRIWVEDTPGGGATFGFLLPLSAPEPCP